MKNVIKSGQRLSILDIKSRKGGDPIVCLTAYSKPMAQWLDPYMDLLLVGDSLAMDVEGPQAVGMHAAWLNRNESSLKAGIVPNYQITILSELLHISPSKVLD